MTETRMPLASDIPYTSSGRIFWTMDRVAQALAPCSTRPAPSGAREFTSISTDTRSITPGTLFVALQGDRFDAHDFLAEAVTSGAAALVVSDAARAAGAGCPCTSCGTPWRRTVPSRITGAKHGPGR